jgi:hypothetical protein
MSKMLETIYPGVERDFYSSNGIPDGYWHEMENRRNYMDWIADQMKIECKEDWYGIRLEDIYKRNGRGLIRFYLDSISDLLRSIYPDSTWDICLFQEENAKSARSPREFMDALGEVLGISHLDDWYGVTKEDIINAGGRSLLEEYGGSGSKLLKAAYPQVNLPFSMQKKILL